MHSEMLASVLCIFLWTAYSQQNSYAETANVSVNVDAKTFPGCKLCRCNYAGKTIDCSNKDFSGGLLAPTMFPTEDTLSL